MTPSDSVAQHIAKIENMANQLKDIEEMILDVMILAKILGSLPAKYNASISAWDSVPAADQTLMNLRERVIREEVRMTTLDDVSSALAAMSLPKEMKKTDNHSGSNNVETRRVLICDFCGKKVHIEKYCYNKKWAAHENSKRGK